MAKVDNQKVITGLVRFSFVHVFEPWGQDDNKKKYQATLLIPKSDKETIRCIKEAIENAKAYGKTSKWHNKIPNKLEIAFYDGEDKADEHPEYEDMMYISAKSDRKPQVIDLYKQPIDDPEEFYSGCWGRASIQFYPYDFNGKKGVACALNNLQKVKDDTRFGASISNAEDDFDDDFAEDYEDDEFAM